MLLIRPPTAGAVPMVQEFADAESCSGTQWNSCIRPIWDSNEFVAAEARSTY